MNTYRFVRNRDGAERMLSADDFTTAINTLAAEPTDPDGPYSFDSAFNAAGEPISPFAPPPYGRNLPIFHTPAGPMTEDAAERAAERYMDRADRALLAGLATRSEYDAWTRALDAWTRRHTQKGA